MKVGDMEKVSLPGEAPWAEVIEVYADGTWLGRITNNLLCGQDGFGDHNFSANDYVVFCKPYMANRGIKVSAPMSGPQQH